MLCERLSTKMLAEKPHSSVLLVTTYDNEKHLDVQRLSRPVYSRYTKK